MAEYKDFAQYMQEKFPGKKVQKVSINAGFSCPNRDGTVGYGGCIYCDNTSFTPGYCFDSSDIGKQIEEGKKFFSRKYKDMQYLAYFQSFSNTFGRPVEELREIYTRTAEDEDVIGIIIGTRPDTLPDSVVEMLSDINRMVPVIVELGAETSHDTTLRLINRGHKWEDVVYAVKRLNEKNISVGLHLIMGLPGETEEMMEQTIRRVIALPIESVKIHQLQVLKGTPLAQKVERGEIELRKFSLDEYVDLCLRIIKLVPKNIAIERFVAVAPPDKLISPKWGVKNYEFVNILKNK